MLMFVTEPKFMSYLNFSNKITTNLKEYFEPFQKQSLLDDYSIITTAIHKFWWLENNQK